jgi:hypothetical protein
MLRDKNEIIIFYPTKMLIASQPMVSRSPDIMYPVIGKILVPNLATKSLEELKDLRLVEMKHFSMHNGIDVLCPVLSDG